jgi:hypothetical protein
MPAKASRCPRVFASCNIEKLGCRALLGVHAVAQVVAVLQRIKGHGVSFLIRGQGTRNLAQSITITCLGESERSMREQQKTFAWA